MLRKHRIDVLKMPSTLPSAPASTEAKVRRVLVHACAYLHVKSYRKSENFQSSLSVIIMISKYENVFITLMYKVRGRRQYTPQK